MFKFNKPYRSVLGCGVEIHPEQQEQPEEPEEGEQEFVPTPMTEKKYLPGVKLLKQIKKNEEKKIDAERLAERLSSVVKLF